MSTEDNEHIVIIHTDLLKMYRGQMVISTINRYHILHQHAENHCVSKTNDLEVVENYLLY